MCRRVLDEDARRIVDQVEQAKTRAQSAARGQTVAAGFGVSIVPQSIRQVAATGVTYHAIDGPGPKALIVIAYRSTEFSKVVQEFLEVARRLTRTRHHDSA